MSERSGATDGCFLCSPNRDWVWAEDDDLFAMTALGPIVEGMSIVATRAHVKSMFDVSAELVDRIDEFTRRAGRHLGETFDAPVHITEHGRVGLCEQNGYDYDEHCLHAHRLLFPADVALTAVLNSSAIEPISATSFSDARQVAGHLTEYLYYESPDGSVLIGTNDESTPRQYFRSLVAEAVGRPELRSWRSHPDYSAVEAAAAKLRSR